MTIDMVYVNVFGFGIFTNVVDNLWLQFTFEVGKPVFGGPNGVNINLNV